MAAYVNQSIPEAPQRRLADRLAVQQERGEESLAVQQQDLKRMAEFLSSINLSKGPHWMYALKTFPRPTGSATHVVITEYDLPKPTRQPHDVIVDSDGTVTTASGSRSWESSTRQPDKQQNTQHPF